MCEYCGHGKPIISRISRDTKFPDWTEEIVAEIECNRLKFSLFIQPINEIWAPSIIEKEIRFCPMCGRKLEVE